MLGEPEIRLGYGAPFLITPYSINLAMAKEMMLTGDIVDAHEAARLGMVNRVVPHDDLIAECQRVAHKIRNIPAIGIKTTKISVNRALESAGFLSALNHNLELMTQFDTADTPEHAEFSRVRAEQGLRAALAWSQGPFSRLAAVVGTSVALLGEADDGVKQGLLSSNAQLALLGGLAALLTEFANQLCNHLNGFISPFAFICQLLLGL